VFILTLSHVPNLAGAGRRSMPRTRSIFRRSAQRPIAASLRICLRHSVFTSGDRMDQSHR
jgi:hypothetical protein